MPSLLAILGLCSAALAGVSTVYYLIVLARLLIAQRNLPTLASPDALRARPADKLWPSIGLIVPAHNEQDVIAEHARSVLAIDYPALHAVLSLDRCTDGTRAEVERVLREVGPAAAARVTIVEGNDTPVDWAGKTNAIRRGLAAAPPAVRDADLLLFTDADITFEPSALRAAVALLEARNLGLLSLLNRLTHDRWFECLVQPAAGFELVRQFPLDTVNREDKPRAFANGQFMLFRRAAYEALGGHDAVKSELLEDIAFARRLVALRLGLRLGVFMSGGLVHCRMYRAWDAFQRGWKRIFTEAAHRRPERLAQSYWRLLLTGVLFPLAGPAALLLALALRRNDPPLSLALLITGGAALSAVIFTLSIIYRAQRAPLWALPLYPCGAWMVARLLRRAALDLARGRATRWAGRDYAREVRA